MKNILSSVLVVSSMLVLAQTASAQIFLTDDFTVSANVNDPNFEIDLGRQTGLDSPASYTAFGSQHQVGNPETDVGQPGGVSNSNYLLLAFNSAVQSNFLIDDTVLNGKPLVVSFDLYLHGANDTRPGFDATDWAAFALRTPGSTFPVADAGQFGFLVRWDGRMQVFSGGDISTPEMETLGFSSSPSWTLTFSDLAGTGSPFAGNGTEVTFVNGANTFTIELPQQFSTTASLAVGFEQRQNVFAGVDNLSIGAVPEPSTVVLITAGLGFLVFFRRSRRA